jgi:hypothetical protein
LDDKRKQLLNLIDEHCKKIIKFIGYVH